MSPRAKRQARMVWTVESDPVRPGWIIDCPDGSKVVASGNKASAINLARTFARSAEVAHVLGQVVVKNAAGAFMFENTYGADPRRSKG